MPPKRRNNTTVIVPPTRPSRAVSEIHGNGPITRRRQLLQNEQCVINGTELMEDAPTSESASLTNLDSQICINKYVNQSLNLVKSRNKFSHTEIYCNGNDGDQRIMNKFEYTNFEENSNGMSLNGNLLHANTNYTTPMIPVPNFTPIENNMNGHISSGIDESLKINDSNVYYRYTKSKTIKYLAEFLLMAYFILSFIFTTRFNNIKSVFEPVREKNTVTFASVEEVLLCKILWCIVFSCLTDFISWRTAFYVQSLIWSLFLASIFVESFPSFYRFLALTSLSSSSMLIASVGVAKIWKGDKWLVSPWIRLYIVSYVFPLCLKIGASKTVRRMMGDTFPSAGVSYIQTAFGKLGDTMCSASALIAGCAICLTLIPALTNDSRPNSSSPGGEKGFYALSWFVRVMVLKVLLYAPSSLWLKFYSRNYENVEETVVMLIPLCLLVHCCIIPICLRVTSRRWTLIFTALVLCLTFSIASFHSAWCSPPCFSLATLCLCAASSSLHTTFESPPALGLKGSSTGLVLGSLVSLHFAIQFLSEHFSGDVALSRAAESQIWTSWREIAMVLGTSLESCFYYIKGNFYSYLSLLQSSLYSLHVFLVYSISKSDMNLEVFINEENINSIINAPFKDDLPTKICSLGENVEGSIEFISFMGITFSGLALLILILSNK